MKVTVDLAKCDGYANCVAAAPGVFDVSDDTGKVIVLTGRLDEESSEGVVEAVRDCPMRALSVEGPS
ncbi:ferredoxin [Streptomyces sp. NPDC002596]|uniref:ferredoxin n=1 Tax=unclassified Streptomyces TaxID=2593676 RepID=UPI002DDA1D4D|nr:ferredoxin [Streptomyces sp. NBC_00841]WRZ96787.1 ferredoxin [Streptomyces sp. NBC_00841]